MNKLKLMLDRLTEGDAAVSTIEYALLASLIAAFCILGAAALGIAVDGLFMTVCRAYPAAPSC